MYQTRQAVASISTTVECPLYPESETKVSLVLPVPCMRKCRVVTDSQLETGRDLVSEVRLIFSKSQL